MIKVTVECIGTKPLMMHPKTEEIMDNIRTGVSKPSAAKMGGQTVKEEAEKCLIRNENGELGLPWIYFLMSMKSAAKNRKYKKALGLTTYDGSFVTSVLEPENEFLLLTGNKQWVPDKRPVPTKTGGSQVCIRPKFKDWGFRAVITINDGLLGKDVDKVFKTLIAEAGAFIGLGAARPLGFGRYKIVSWEVLERVEEGESEEPEGE